MWQHHYRFLIPISSFLLCRNQIQKIYPLNSNTPITSSQVQEILNVAKSNNLPTQRCCQQAQKFAQAKCACDTTLPPALAQVGFQVTNVGLQSADQFTSKACNFSPTSCSNSGWTYQKTTFRGLCEIFAEFFVNVFAIRCRRFFNLPRPPFLLFLFPAWMRGLATSPCFILVSALWCSNNIPWHWHYRGPIGPWFE